MGKLIEVDIRKLWTHEQYDFSNWLAEKENLELLNEVIGLTLSEIEKEVYVGSYRCDLVGKDEVTGEKVIIENQLEASNHDQLINEMIDKAYYFDSRLKKEEELGYIGCLANDYLNRMRENKDFLVSQGLNFDLVNCNFVIDERIVELTKKYKYVSLLDIEREKNLDFLKKEFSLKKF